MAKSGRKRKAGVKREPNGRAVRGGNNARVRAEDALSVVRAARERVLTCALAAPRARERTAKAAPVDIKAEALNPMAGFPIGRAILAQPKEQRADLWTAAQHVCRAVRNFDAAMGKTRTAKVAHILAPRDPLATSAADPAWDDRTEAQRDDDAVRAVMALQEWTGRYGPRAYEALVDAVYQTDGETYDPEGVVFLLSVVSDGLKGRIKRSARNGR